MRENSTRFEAAEMCDDQHMGVGLRLHREAADVMQDASRRCSADRRPDAQIV
jgi:hypothetical protein